MFAKEGSEVPRKETGLHAQQLSSNIMGVLLEKSTGVLKPDTLYTLALEAPAGAVVMVTSRTVQRDVNT